MAMPGPISGSGTHFDQLDLLTQDGAAPPAQISLLLTINDAATFDTDHDATATCQYKRAVDSTYTTCHPLYRIRPELSDTPDVGTVVEGFAWTIIDLTPGTSYN